MDELEKSGVKKVVESTKQVVEGVKDKTGKIVEKTVAPVTEAVKKGAEAIAESEKVKAAVDTTVQIAKKVAENKVVKAVADELLEEVRERRKEFYIFRSPYKREKDKKEGIIWNPYSKKLEKIETLQIDTKTTALQINQKKKMRHGLSKVVDVLDRVSDNLEGTNNYILRMAKSAIGTTGNVVDSVGRAIFKPNETSEVLSAIKERDPDFDIEKFLWQVEYHIMPKVLNAYFNDDEETLKCYTTTTVWIFFINYITSNC